MFEISANEIRVLHKKYFSQSSYFNMPMLLYHAIIGIVVVVSAGPFKYMPTFVTPYLWFMVPTVFSLSLFCILTVLLLLFLVTSALHLSL